jgi:hypothetical protein
MNSLQNNKITPPVAIKEGEESKWTSSPPPIASFLQPILYQTQNSQAPQPSPNSGGRMATRAKSNTVTFAPSTTSPSSSSSSSISRSAIGNGGRQKAFSDCTQADYDPAEHGGGDGSVRSSRVDAKFHSVDNVNSTVGSFDSYGISSNAVVTSSLGDNTASDRVFLSHPLQEASGSSDRTLVLDGKFAYANTSGHLIGVKVKLISGENAFEDAKREYNFMVKENNRRNLFMCVCVIGHIYF